MSKTLEFASATILLFQASILLYATDVDVNLQQETGKRDFVSVVFRCNIYILCGKKSS